jgi:hypothetical protein
MTRAERLEESCATGLYTSSYAIEVDHRCNGIARDGSVPYRLALNVERATWAFVGLGVLLRIVRYGMNYPLWWDEAFVAVNFIRRDYVDLLRPLDFGQVCPILFLWAELTLVKLLGFSEWSLRLFPLACAVVSVVLFRYVARCVMGGVPLLMAVAIFAVSYHPIRHSADVKPYASDLLAALALLGAALAWLQAPQSAPRMWALAAIAPVAISLSHPAAFMVAGIVIGLVPAVAITKRRDIWIAFATFALGAAATFLALYSVFTHAQAAATLGVMQAEWKDAFPPWSDICGLARWLVVVHTGSMFAYPCGGDRGASALTLILFALGAAVLWRRGERVALLTCLAPFGVALAAAAIKRYPYGAALNGSAARVMQYLVPIISLLTGLGAAAVIAGFRNPGTRARVVRVSLMCLVAIGSIPLAAEAGHPFRTIHAQRARQFARRFWPALARDAEPVCLRWDLRLGEWDSTNLNVAVYLCNQMIYSPARRRKGSPRWDRISANHPLRCVLSFSNAADPRVAGWLNEMKKRYRLKECRAIAVNMAEASARPRTEYHYVYEFVPADDERPRIVHAAQSLSPDSGQRATMPPPG